MTNAGGVLAQGNRVGWCRFRHLGGSGPLFLGHGPSDAGQEGHHPKFERRLVGHGLGGLLS